jgi:Skp family chaperone for outer membrane proteins
MKIYVVDFEEVLKNFTPYHESLKKIQSEKQKFADDIEDIKKEMETIVNSSRSLLLDENTQRDNANRFKDLQTKAIKLESEFRNDIVTLQNSELEQNFKQVSEIVQDWSSKENLDLVINKSQALFVSEKYDATSKIVDILKEKELYQEYNESEFLIEM